MGFAASVAVYFRVVSYAGYPVSRVPSSMSTSMGVGLLGDFSEEQCSSLKIILGSKHVGAILNVLI
jgi:hypothetical protein